MKRFLFCSIWLLLFLLFVSCSTLKEIPATIPAATQATFPSEEGSLRINAKPEALTSPATTINFEEYKSQIEEYLPFFHFWYSPQIFHAGLKNAKENEKDLNYLFYPLIMHYGDRNDSHQYKIEISDMETLSIRLFGVDAGVAPEAKKSIEDEYFTIAGGVGADWMRYTQKNVEITVDKANVISYIYDFYEENIRTGAPVKMTGRYIFRMRIMNDSDGEFLRFIEWKPLQTPQENLPTPKKLKNILTEGHGYWRGNRGYSLGNQFTLKFYDDGRYIVGWGAWPEFESEGYYEMNDDGVLIIHGSDSRYLSFPESKYVYQAESDSFVSITKKRPGISPDYPNTNDYVTFEKMDVDKINSEDPEYIERLLTSEF